MTVLCSLSCVTVSRLRMAPALLRAPPESEAGFKRLATSERRASEVYWRRTLGTLVGCCTKAMLLKSDPFCFWATMVPVVSIFTSTAASHVYMSGVDTR